MISSRPLSKAKVKQLKQLSVDQRAEDQKRLESVAIPILEEISEGSLIKTALEKHGVSKSTWWRWMRSNQNLYKAFIAARQMSAFSFEDQALEHTGRMIDNLDGVTAPMVAAYNAAMAQLRWSATRRNPAEFGDQKTVNVRVPITINTTLNLGTGEDNLDSEDIYNISVTATPNLEFTDGEVDKSGDQASGSGEESREEGGGEPAPVYGEGEGSEGKGGSTRKIGIGARGVPSQGKPI
jgi:hypothetical protein